ncbi:TetR/AcrR family transcriptional regulator [Frankia nepalensis]|uniref:TetR/AcrR family transcriptional regulator n=1 Tax=Frankia nepalensis TaxID=1836974 RepID=UPI0027DC0A2C|nr:helix-turn-helix domain-containing protein [Frankia nepalensis]
MYDNRSRRAAAGQTRQRVLAAARESFLTHGYAGTTIRAVAAAAGVSQETVYKRFGGKAGLLKAVYDVTLAGDDEPISFADRPEARAMRAASGARDSARAYAAMAAGVAGRIGQLLDIVLNIRGGDPELEAFAARIDQERLLGATAAVSHWSSLGLLRDDLSVDAARDVVWMLISPAVDGMLRQRGWSRADYQEWLARTLLATVLRDEVTATASDAPS